MVAKSLREKKEFLKHIVGVSISKRKLSLCSDI